MTRAILACFHKYTPYGGEFYAPMYSFFIQQMKKYQDEFDALYLIDSTWNIDKSDVVTGKTHVFKVNPHLRYYDAYKAILPDIKEDLLLLMDNDMVVYRNGIIRGTFLKLEPSKDNKDTYDVVSIYDTIGEKRFPQLNGKSKFCPYWFAASKNLLMKYKDCEWGPVPWGETLSELTQFMLNDRIRPFEWEEDKSNILFDGTKDPEKGKNLGYYHIRSGSLSAVLLAWRENQPEQYWKYLKEQPRTEYLRQCAWYHHMESETSQNPGKTWEIIRDLNIIPGHWVNYMNKFKEFHGLI